MLFNELSRLFIPPHSLCLFLSFHHVAAIVSLLADGPKERVTALHRLLSQGFAFHKSGVDSLFSGREKLLHLAQLLSKHIRRTDVSLAYLLRHANTHTHTPTLALRQAQIHASGSQRLYFPAFRRSGSSQRWMNDYRALWVLAGEINAFRSKKKIVPRGRSRKAVHD